ncbi:PQQ-binding-like beta-propeller repeat protein [Planctomycetota bacterium]
MKQTTLSLILLSALFTGTVMAADSPQFRGPNRDGKFPETGLMKSWPADGPPVAWVAKGFGQGHGSVSVVGDSIYVPGRLDDGQGYLFTVGLDGSIKDKASYGTETNEAKSPGARSTPTIDGDRAYIMSGLGVVSCLNVKSGKVLWQVDTFQKFGAPQIRWHIAESILIDGDLAICTPGGKDASLVALNKMTGATVWQTKGLSDKSAYCSPDIIEHGGKRIVITMTAAYVVGVDVTNGEVLWTHEHETKYDIHGTTPVYADGMVYYSAGYGSGGGMIELSADGTKVTQKWKDMNIDCQHHGIVLLDGYLYATSQKGKKLWCLDLKTGDVMWSADEITQAVVEYADGMLYTYEGPQAGVVSLVKATPQGYERTGSFKFTAGNSEHWAHPTIANGRMYIRRGDTVVAYDIAAK